MVQSALRPHGAATGRLGTAESPMPRQLRAVIGLIINVVLLTLSFSSVHSYA
jgi:hypothetical protein